MARREMQTIILQSVVCLICTNASLQLKGGVREGGTEGRNEFNEQSRYIMKMSVYQVMSLIKIY